MRPARRPAALVLTCAALAAGCGGDAEERNAYVDDVQVAQRTFVDRFDVAREGLSATSTLEQDRAALAGFASAAEKFGAALDDVEPPSEVRKEHDRLVAAVASLGSRVERAAAGLTSGSRKARAKVRTDLSSSVETTQDQIAEAITAINRGLRDQ